VSRSGEQVSAREALCDELPQLLDVLARGGIQRLFHVVLGQVCRQQADRRQMDTSCDQGRHDGGQPPGNPCDANSVERRLGRKTQLTHAVGECRWISCFAVHAARIDLGDVDHQ
jgi:hypothetical protein